MIRTNDISFSYRAGVPVLKNITMSMEEGRIYGLLGENGVGKTTLLTLLCGLKKPQAGTIDVDGHSPFKREPSLLGNQYYLSEEAAPAPLTARQYARTYGKFWERFDIGKFEELMRLFENDTEKRMDRMSTGQLKKVHICFALACNTKYLFMDEPTNGLDIPSKAQFRKAVSMYTAEDSTLVISTHQVRDLENIIDPIIILDRQDVLLNASLEEISDKLYFDYSPERREGALYSEMTVAGSISVYPNATGEESKVNIEALFNTVHLHKRLLKGMFAGETAGAQNETAE
ncbi:MAG: ABC transporter ATP-binding protein [Bacteroidales bacterium]|nr:ABC transporter ATP-binding protein [Bacteroidales bacterium]